VTEPPPEFDARAAVAPVAGAPAISVIVCTCDRPHLLARALTSVARAAALTPETAIEIIVVDDGEAPPLSRVPTQWVAGPEGEPPRDPSLGLDPHARVVAGPRAGAGAARAAGLAAARGALIAWCDDDDEWLPEHLAVLLAALGTHPEWALVYGDAVWRDTDGQPFAAAPPARVPELGFADDVHASDVLLRVDAARDVGGFDPSLRAYEDIDLWLRMDEAHLLHHLPISVTTHDRHPDAVTTRGHPDERERLLRLHARRRPCRDPAPRRLTQRFDPDTWQPPLRELHWQSPLNTVQSFGLVGRQLLLAARRAGIAPILTSPPPADDPALRRFPSQIDGNGRIGFSYDYWHRPDPLPAELLVLATMREGTLVPRARVNAINQTAALLYVPCRQNLESFRACGVRVPIAVLPYGVDPVRFPFLERPRDGDEPFTFGTFGALSPRKGTDVLLRAFREEFTLSEPVRLLLKSVDELPLTTDDPRIRVISGFSTEADLLEFLRGLDAFVLPSRAEGFGLCGLEAMATGLPAIATAWSGPADYLDPADTLPLHFRLIDAAATEANGVRYFGEWAEPDIDHLRSLLRWLYEHRDEAAAMGQHASARIHREWTWDRAATQLRADLDLLASGVSVGC
jgi:glycosyltransferase involved in cell wall biosynthesis